MESNMWKKGLVLGIIVLFIGASIIPSTGNIVSENYSQPDTVYVDDDYNESTPGWGYDHFDSIQDGVDAVNESGTVYVYSGTYNESLIIDKSNLLLIGEDISSTIIDANGLPDGLYVTKNNFSIFNFTIRNGYQDGIVIRSSSNCEINNCILYNFSFHGIVLYSYTDGEANNNSISNWSIFNNGKNGIRLYGGYNDMRRNRIVDSNVFPAKTLRNQTNYW